MLILLILHLTIQKSKENLTLHHMGKFLLVNLLGYNLKSGGLHFLKVFYYLKILGWSSRFRAIDTEIRQSLGNTSFF